MIDSRNLQVVLYVGHVGKAHRLRVHLQLGGYVTLLLLPPPLMPLLWQLPALLLQPPPPALPPGVVLMWLARRPSAEHLPATVDKHVPSQWW
jgi:hypothetical protein